MSVDAREVVHVECEPRQAPQMAHGPHEAQVTQIMSLVASSDIRMAAGEPGLQQLLTLHGSVRVQAPEEWGVESSCFVQGESLKGDLDVGLELVGGKAEQVETDRQLGKDLLVRI